MASCPTFSTGDGKLMRICLAILSLSVILSAAFPPPPGLSAQGQDPKKTQEQQDPQKKTEPAEDVISVETNLIVVNVTVTDAIENYVSGLKAEDFKIFEDAKPQK